MVAIEVIASCSKRLSAEQRNRFPVVAIACIQPLYHAEGLVAIVILHGLEITAQQKNGNKNAGQEALQEQA